MENPLVISLIVSGIGMLMLFLALAFLYVLMYLMTTFLNDRQPETGAQETGGGKQETRSGMRRAAAIAVALARAEQEVSATGAPEERGTINGWRMLHRQRQLTRNTPTRRTQ
ncbi:MAG: hypothetical protein DRJ03_04295 [Chloroflexi bacterium]|nr:MAG: hypothetical protein DRJ03_04295 [Chloroflexota bacterium]HEY72352.1 hypothetical protein [Thermoflexia bacterium]